MSGTGSLILQTENGVTSAAAISNDVVAISNDAETDEELAAAIKQFLRIDDEGGDSGNSDEEGDEYIIHANSIENTEQLNSNEVEYSPEDDRGKVRDHVRLTGTGRGLKIGTISLENDQSSVVPSDRSHDIKIPRVPESFSLPVIDPSRNCPLFEAADNPGN